MVIESSLVSRTKPDPTDGERVAKGLAIVRASTLKMIRLQLAMERHDRRVALEVIDDLVALDDRLQDFLTMAPASDDEIRFRHQLAADRAMLNREKHALAAEVLRRPSEGAIKERPPANNAWPGPRELNEDPPRQRHWLFVLLILASAVAAGAYFLGALRIESWLAAAGFG